MPSPMVAIFSGEFRLPWRVKILWPGDIHALAEFILRCRGVTDEIANARNTGSVQKSMPTINGLVGHFANVTDVPTSQIKKVVRKCLITKHNAM